MAKVTKLDALNSILASLSASSGEIEACAVVSSDGLMMASNFPAGMDEDRLAALCRRNAKLGLIFLDMARAAAEVAKII